MAKTETKTEQAATYTKAQLTASKKYANQRDIISALLDDGKAYTLDEVDALINKYMKGKVK